MSDYAKQLAKATKRRAAMVAAKTAGDSASAIARRYRISRQRVSAILKEESKKAVKP